MVGPQFGIVKPQFTIMSISFLITLNKDRLIKTNDVNAEVFEDCSSIVHHWLHHI